MMKAGAAESAPLLQRDDETNKPKPGAIAAAVRQAKRGVGVFGVALALSGVLVAIMAGGPDASKKRARGVLKTIYIALASRSTSTSRRWRHVPRHRRDAPRRRSRP